MRMTKDKKLKILLFGSIILLSIIGVVYSYWLRTLPQTYTIGEIEKIWKPRSGGIVANFRYVLSGQEYLSSSKIGSYDKVAKIGSRFIVSVPDGHLSEGRLLFHLQVKNEVSAPDEGWRKIPKSVLADKFK
jgi:hypothetical protein